MQVFIHALASYTHMTYQSLLLHALPVAYFYQAHEVVFVLCVPGLHVDKLLQARLLALLPKSIKFSKLI